MFVIVFGAFILGAVCMALSQQANSKWSLLAFWTRLSVWAVARREARRHFEEVRRDLRAAELGPEGRAGVLARVTQLRDQLREKAPGVVASLAAFNVIWGE